MVHLVLQYAHQGLGVMITMVLGKLEIVVSNSPVFGSLRERRDPRCKGSGADD